MSTHGKCHNRRLVLYSTIGHFLGFFSKVLQGESLRVTLSGSECLRHSATKTLMIVQLSPEGQQHQQSPRGTASIRKPSKAPVSAQIGSPNDLHWPSERACQCPTVTSLHLQQCASCNDGTSGAKL